MHRLHLLGGVADWGHNVFKDLSVTQHPVSVEQHQHWGKFEPIKSVLGQLVIK